MINKSKKAAYCFMKQYKLKNITFDKLKKVMEQQGYTVVEYNIDVNTEEVDVLICELDLFDYVRSAKGFTYADSNYRLVFVNENLSEYEKIVVLAHEEGHIFQEHFNESAIIGRDVIQEYEANEFAHYILNLGFSFKILYYKNAVILSIISAIVLTAGIMFARTVIIEKTYYGEFYITNTGSKYHEAECIFIKDKSNVRRLTKEEFESGKYEPCGICLPHGEDF